MIHTWKVPQIVKGMLTYVPALNDWRLRRGVTGGSDASRYCYAVWLRHLVILHQHGFNLKGAVVGELGPGDSIGTGLAALLSGAGRYVGLDVVPYSAHADLTQMLTDLAEMYESREPIPGPDEFPKVRPSLSSYAFPDDLIDSEAVAGRVEALVADLKIGVNAGTRVSYHAPWISKAVVEPASLDLMFSQGVLQCVNVLDETYQAMFGWLKPGGYCSHSIGCAGIYLSPFWNGHWAYTDLQWRVVMGRRHFLLNREPLSTHLRLARSVGFEVVHLERQYGEGGLAVQELSPRFQALDAEDARTRHGMLILRKPR